MVSNPPIPHEGWDGLTRLLAFRSEEREAALRQAVALYEATPSRANRTRLRAALRIGLTDRDVSVRTYATERIGAYGDASDAFALRDRTSDAELAVRVSAVSSLGTLLGKRARKDLGAALASDDPFVRRYAAVALHDALGAEALPIVGKAYATERDELALSGMAYVLAFHGDDAARKRLADLATSPYPRVSSPARTALDELSSP